jgi:hypothetical protein
MGFVLLASTALPIAFSLIGPNYSAARGRRVAERTTRNDNDAGTHHGNGRLAFAQPLPRLTREAEFRPGASQRVGIPTVGPPEPEPEPEPSCVALAGRWAKPIWVERFFGFLAFDLSACKPSYAIGHGKPPNIVRAEGQMMCDGVMQQGRESCGWLS